MLSFRATFFEYIDHIGCAINSHSITNSGLLPGGQKLSKRQTVFFTSVDPMNEGHKDPDILTWMHRVLHGTSRKRGRNIKTRCIQTCAKERIYVLSDAIERNHPLRHTPSLLYPEGYHDGNWRNHVRESICVTSTSSKGFLEKFWMKELGSEVAGDVESSQQTQPQTTNPIVRTGRLVSTGQPFSSSAQEIDKRVLLDCDSTNVSVGR